MTAARILLAVARQPVMYFDLKNRKVVYLQVDPKPDPRLIELREKLLRQPWRAGGAPRREIPEDI